MKRCAHVVTGVIDIGTSTTRLLVADVVDDQIRPIAEHRHFVSPTRMGARAYSDLLAAEVARAEDHGAEEVAVLATAALRGSHLARGLARRCRQAGIPAPRVLSTADEAALAFLGAGAGHRSARRIAVVDCGGGSTEIAVGRPGRRPEWWSSRPIGSRRLIEHLVRSDPPTATETVLMLDAARRELTTLRPPASDLAVVAGNPRASLGLVCGPRLNRESIAAARERLHAGDAATVAGRLELDPRRVRYMLGTLALLEAAAEHLGQELQIGHGGIREGLILARHQGLNLGGTTSEEVMP